MRNYLINYKTRHTQNTTLKRNTNLNNFSIYDEPEKDKNPFAFEAFASVNKLATLFNYDVFAVSEHKQKDNPFQMMNRNISFDIKCE